MEDYQIIKKKVVDEMGVDEMGVDEMGGHHSFSSTKPIFKTNL